MCENDIVEKNQVKVTYIATYRQPADILTKALGFTKFESCLKLLNLPALSNKVKI